MVKRHEQLTAALVGLVDGGEYLYQTNASFAQGIDQTVNMLSVFVGAWAREAEQRQADMDLLIRSVKAGGLVRGVGDD